MNRLLFTRGLKTIINLALLAAAITWLILYWPNLLQALKAESLEMSAPNGTPATLIEADRLLFIVLGIAGIASLSSGFWHRLSPWVRITYALVLIIGLAVCLLHASYPDLPFAPRGPLEKLVTSTNSAWPLLILAASTFIPVVTGNGYAHYVSSLFRKKSMALWLRIAGIAALCFWMALVAIFVLANFVVLPQVEIAKSKAYAKKRMEDQVRQERISTLARVTIEDLGTTTIRDKNDFRDLQISLTNSSPAPLWVRVVDAKILNGEIRSRNPLGIETRFESQGKRWALTQEGVYMIMGSRAPRLEIPANSTLNFVIPVMPSRLSKTHDQIRAQITIFESPTALEGAPIFSAPIPIARDSTE